MAGNDGIAPIFVVDPQNRSVAVAEDDLLEARNRDKAGNKNNVLDKGDCPKGYNPADWDRYLTLTYERGVAFATLNRVTRDRRPLTHALETLDRDQEKQSLTAHFQQLTASVNARLPAYAQVSDNHQFGSDIFCIGIMPSGRGDCFELSPDTSERAALLRATIAGQNMAPEQKAFIDDSGHSSTLAATAVGAFLRLGAISDNGYPTDEGRPVLDEIENMTYADNALTVKLQGDVSIKFSNLTDKGVDMTITRVVDGENRSRRPITITGYTGGQWMSVRD
jgi:hypothetical protein